MLNRGHAQLKYCDRTAAVEDAIGRSSAVEMASGGGGGGGGAVKMQTEEMDSTPAAGQLAALQYEEVLAAGLAFFDRIEASVDTAYSGAAAQRMHCSLKYTREKKHK